MSANTRTTTTTIATATATVSELELESTGLLLKVEFGVETWVVDSGVVVVDSGVVKAVVKSSRLIKKVAAIVSSLCR